MQILHCLGRRPVRGDYVPVVTVSRHPLPWVVCLAGGWVWPVGVAAGAGSEAVTWRSDRLGVIVTR